MARVVVPVVLGEGVRFFDSHADWQLGAWLPGRRPEDDINDGSRVRRGHSMR
jgi:hypothetical protein